jgi:uncharacterized protein (TIGR02246 family)
MGLRFPNPKTQIPAKFQALNLKQTKPDEITTAHACVAVGKANGRWRGSFNVFATNATRGLSVFHQPSLDMSTDKSLLEADLKKIDDITQTAMNAALARDFATWAALFFDDAVVSPPNEPPVKGKAAIRTWLEKFPPITEFKLNNEKIDGREDFAYVLGSYTMTILPSGAPGPVKDSGKFVTVVRRQPDGRWLCALDMFSSNLPPPTIPK